MQQNLEKREKNYKTLSQKLRNEPSFRKNLCPKNHLFNFPVEIAFCNIYIFKAFV